MTCALGMLVAIAAVAVDAKRADTFLDDHRTEPTNPATSAG